MSATKVLWGQIVVVFAIVLATMWGATQWVLFSGDLGNTGRLLLRSPATPPPRR
jgi:type IV secretion system protein VirD4